MTTKRGRTSIAELMIPENPIDTVQRPDAPYDLDDEESAEWRAQVSAMPADHFTRNTFPMLAQLCRHVVATRRLSQLMQAVLKPGKDKSFDQRGYAQLLEIQRAESTAITRLSRSMRLTQQASTKPETLGRKLRNQAIIQAPWDKSDE